MTGTRIQPRPTRPEEKTWKLRYKGRQQPGESAGEHTYETEVAFISALNDARRNFATDISATLPDGTVLNETELKRRYPA